MPAWITTIIAICKAIPAIESLVQLFIAEYTRARVSAMKKEHRDAIKQTIILQDQIELEKLIGGKGGENSGIPGVDERDSIGPRV